MFSSAPFATACANHDPTTPGPKKSPARTDFHQFADRSHFLAGEKGWEDVARYAIDWAAQATAASIH